MAEWHHRCNGHERGQTVGDGKRQGGLGCCSPWDCDESGTTGDEMVGGHHRRNGHELGQTLGDGERQGGLGCCSSWGGKGLDVTERLN